MNRMTAPCASSISFRTAFSRSSNSPRYLAPGDHGPEVERHDALVLEAFGHVSHVDAAGEPLDDRGLADARLADQDGVVLRAAREHLDDAADLLVASDDGVDLAPPRQIREVPRVALQGLVLVLGVRVRDARRAPDLFQGLEESVLLRARGGEALAGVPLFGESDQEVLGRDVLVAELLRGLERRVEDARQVASGPRLGGRAGHVRLAVEDRPSVARQRRGIDAELLEDRDDDALGLLEERQKQVVGE